jgi:hypothetical protein
VSEDEPGTLKERTTELLKNFAAEDKGYAFNDGGDGTMYAEWFADLLSEWLERSPAAPPPYEPDFMSHVQAETLHGTSILTVRLTHLPTGVTVAARDRQEAIYKLRKALAGHARRHYDLQEAERRRQRKAAGGTPGAA